MAAEDLPTELIVPTRDENADKYKRDYRLRNPEADVTSGQVDQDARMVADVVQPFYANCVTIADGINEDDAQGPQLDRVGDRLGLKRPGATGATGYVVIEASPGGADFERTVHELRNEKTRIRYAVAESVHREDGEHLRIVALDKGPSSDAEAGVVLAWVNPPPGCGNTAVVVEQGDGAGLTGGADAASDEVYRQLIRAKKANPPAGDNEAELIDVLTKTPDVPVEQVFIVAGIYGPGSAGFYFTTRTSRLGASRIPTTAQLQAAHEWMVSQFPGDAGYFPLVQVAQDAYLYFNVTWQTGGWRDVAPWPRFAADSVAVSSVTNGSQFQLTYADGGLPQVGQALAFWDDARGRFSRKVVGASSTLVSSPVTIVCETANSASDTAYVPYVGQRPGPWSDNLAALGPVALAYMATLGPGEVFAPAFIPSLAGRRRRRFPYAPKAWPYRVTDRVSNLLSDAPSVSECESVAGVDDEVAPAFPPNQVKLRDLVFYPPQPA